MLGSLTLTQISIFIAVAESGSFRAGAIRVSRVQSAVSHAIASLEAELGVTLFDRSGRRPRLTPEGRALLIDARAILLKLDIMRARAAGMGHGVELELSIGVDYLFPLAVVGAALNEVRDVFPSVGVRLAVSALGGPIAALDKRLCHIGIIMGEIFATPQIEVEALLPVPFLAVVGSTHPLATRAASGGKFTAFELADHLQIVLEDASSLSEGRFFGVMSPGTWRVNSQDAKHALIVAGLGWGRLPMWLIERDLVEGRLIQLNAPALGQGGKTAVQAYLARRTDEPLGPAAKLFRDTLLREDAASRKGRPISSASSKSERD